MRDGTSYCGKCGRGLGTPMPGLPWTWSADMDGSVSCAGVSADGHRTAAGNQWGAVRYFDEAGGVIWEIDITDGVHPRRAHELALSPDGRTVIAARSDGVIRCFDEDGRVAWELLRHNQRAKLAFSADGKRIVVSHGLLLSPAGEVLAEAPGFGRVFAEGPSGFVAAPRDGSHTVGLFDWDGRQLWSRSAKKEILSAAISQDGESAAIADVTGQVSCMSRTGEKLWVHSVENDHGGPGRVSDEVVAICLGGKGRISLMACEEEFDRSNGSVVAVDGRGKRLWRRYLGIPPVFMRLSQPASVLFAGGYVHTFLFSGDGSPRGKLGESGIETGVQLASRGGAIVGFSDHTVGYLKL